MPDDFKPYSIDDYDKFTMEDYSVILKAFTDENNKRLQIMRYLAKEAKDEQSAKERVEIANRIGVSVVDTLEHCNALRNIGAIRQIRSERRGDRGPKERIKYYLAVEDVVEILALLNAAMLGLDKNAAKRIKQAITKIFNRSRHKIRYGIYSSIFEMQEQILDAITNITHSYTQTQKDIIKWWSTVTEFNMRNYYYYSWFYPASIADIASKAFRPFTDYAISGLNIAQNNMDAYIDMSKTYSGLVEDNINETTQIAQHTPNMFGAIPKASITANGIGNAVSDVEDGEYDLSVLKKLRADLTEILHIALSSA